MAYYQRLQKYRDSIYGGAPYIGDVSNLVPLPPDQSQNIYADKVKQMNDQLAENITAPFTTIGAADLARRGVSNIPAVKRIRELYNQGSELKDKLGNLLSDDQITRFLEDPQEALKGVSEATRSKVLQAIGEVKDTAISKLGELNVPDVGDITQQLVNKIPNASDIASEIGKQAADRATGSLTAQASSLRDQASSLYSSIFGAPEVQAKNAELDRLPTAALTDTKSQATDLNKAGADDGEEEFLDARDFNQLDTLPVHEGLPDDVKELYDLHNDNINQLNKLSATNWEPQAGSGEQLDAFRALKTRTLPPDSEAAQLSDISGEKSTVNGLQASIEKEAGTSAAGDTALEGVGASDDIAETAGLAVGDAIPGLGTLADLATIGAIIGEAVESESDKQKLAKDEAAQEAREAAIQQDIVQQQSQLIGQARQENIQQQEENQILSQQRNTQNTVPVGQVARD